MTEFHTGDRVKVEYEGVVLSEQSYLNPDRVRVRRDDGHVVLPLNKFCTLIEPAYESEGIYMDDMGIVWRRTRGNGCKPWQKVTNGVTDRPHGYFPHDAPVRPLRRMRPE